MIDLTDNQASQFFHRSYSVIDGLWFMKIEEKYGFETALEIDNEVWKVMPKIQARTHTSICKAKQDINSLCEMLETKFTLEGIKNAGLQNSSSNRPVANISFALNYYFHKYNVLGYHLVNILIHVTTGILLYLFVKTTLSLPSLP